jgi:type VI secretion system FHA domain protein
MLLTLEVTGPQGGANAPAGRHVFTTAGGVIGRAKSSDWVLPNPKVSGRHAIISFLDGVFYIEDSSTNGVAINSPGNRLVAGRRYALQAGDRLLIDPYEIEVAVATSGEDARVIQSPLAFGPAAGGAPGAIASPRPSTPEAVLEELDPLKLIGGGPSRPPARQGPSAEALEHRSVMSDHFEPPAVVRPPSPPPSAGSALIPDNYDPLDDEFLTPPAPPQPQPRAPYVRVEIPPPVVPLDPGPPARPPAPAPLEFVPAPSVPVPVRAEPPPPPAPAPEPEQRSDPALAALLAGAGLENVQPTPELARSFGEIFRVVVSGVMDVLQSRQQVKDEFRMEMTHFRPANNNPLKFSANVDDALHNLLVKRNPAYLGPVDAFEDAFDDLRNHQLAVLAGMRVAFDSLLREFDPDRLEKEFDRQLKQKSWLDAVARSRYWELFRERREQMARDPDACFTRLFGEEFARAYDEQLKRLKSEGRERAAANRAAASRPPDQG